MKNLIAFLIFILPFISVFSQDFKGLDHSENFYCEDVYSNWIYYESRDYRDCCCCNKYRRYRCYRIISTVDLSELINLIKGKWFESEKIDYIKEAIDKSYFSSSQARKLIELLWFESSKLQIAKYIYPKIIDPQRFHEIYDLFWFESSIDELKEFISTFPRIYECR